MKKISFLILTALLSLVCTEAFAGGGNSKNYYFKATATSVDAAKGLVYAAAAATTDKEYVAEDEVTATESTTSSSANHTFYYYAKAEDGYKFAGWTADPTAETIDTVSAANPYSARLSSNSTNQASPATAHFYALFEEATEFFSSAVVAQVVGAEGLVSVADTAGCTVFAAAMNDSVLNSGEAVHTYHLQAKPVHADSSKFIGWYTDEACENRLSANANYTYTVTAESQDAAAPSVFPVYAKFEKIPYYSSKVVAAAVGEGGVAVALANNAAVEYAASAELAQLNIKENAAHTYYLKAETDDADFIDFQGWYSDASCETLLSTSAAYTYKVTAASNDTLAPTIFNVYAKFAERNPYQFRNAGFEVWNANLNEPAPGWHGPETAIGSYVGMARGLAPAPERVAGRNGDDYAVRLTSKTATVVFISVKTNGNLTTGIMNMGSATASDESNNNHTVLDDPAHRLIIAGQPDSMAIYSKFKKGENKDYLASATVYLHDAVEFQDPAIAAQAENMMSKVQVLMPESEDWVRSAGAFIYEEGWDAERVDTTTKYVLCDITTNPHPGESTKDTLTVDDITLIYNSELLSATYGTDTIIFTEGQNSNFAAVTYNAEQLHLAANGRGAEIETAYDAASAQLTITVKGQDIEWNESNFHVYTMQFAAGAATSLESVANEAYAVEGIYDAMGHRFSTLQPGINIIRMKDGSCRKVMK